MGFSEPILLALALERLITILFMFTEETGESGVARGPPIVITLVKDGAGLGFSLEGGKDSPLGDQPLAIKKIFTGLCSSTIKKASTITFLGARGL